MATRNVAPVSTSDFRRLAEKKLPRFLFDYIDGGANDEVTMAANCDDFRSIKLRQRVMRDVSNISTKTTLLGKPVDFPLALAPVGMAGMMARRGEVLGATAAKEANVPFTLSTLGVCTLEEITAATGEPIWFQLYMLRDRDAVKALLKRALDNGVNTLLFTVDLPMPGLRRRDVRNGMYGGEKLAMAVGKATQLATKPGWILDVGIKGKPHTVGNLSDIVPDPTNLDAYAKFIDSQFDQSVTWKDIEWLRSIWPGKLAIKGVLEADDARAARDAGADAVIVSNHGARQLDSVASSISKLPGIAEAVGSDVEVLIDGGIRSGIDLVKALALGADGALIGRPWIWSAAGAGKAGVSKLLSNFKQEMRVAMALMGVNDVSELNADLIDR